MNRILFEKDEITGGVATFDGVRAGHVLGVLHGEVGQVLKTGELDGPVGTGEITAIDGRRVTVRVTHDSEAPAPWVDLVLAPPRPRVMKRLLPQLAAMGVGRIVLVGAKKVEKDFWGATLLKEPVYRPLLIDGLMQAGTSAVPVISVERNFRKWLAEKLDGEFPTEYRVVAHPYAAGGVHALKASAGRLLLAIGPEGGWTDEEVARLEEKGFSRFSLGQRILRTDTAAIALLAVLDCAGKNMLYSEPS